MCVKGGDPYNKKHTKYEGNGSKTQRKSKDEMARPLKRDLRISSDMVTAAKHLSVMVKGIDNGHLHGKIRKRLGLGEHYKVLYDTGFSLGTISINKMSILYPLFHTTFGLVVMGKLALKIACISYPVLEKH